MSLKSFMEQKQLDFNQPLLSVRKLSSKVLGKEPVKGRKTAKDVPKFLAAPVYRSELKSGPVRNPGTVPFLWEQSPGRPKDEKASQNQSVERPPFAPKLPPGRNLDVKQHVLNTQFVDTAAGQSEIRLEVSHSERIALIEQHTVKDDIVRDVMEEAEISDSEDGTDAFVDALDALSRSESFYMNCSISGVSELDGPNFKPSGTFSTDPQTRDFMMGRFLPAAKAMASETPQHAASARKNLVAQKQLIAEEQPTPRHMVVSVERRQPLNKFRQDNIRYHAHGIRVEEIEDDSDNGDYDGLGPSNSSICGLFPRLCLQNSFCLLNPVPAMRKQAQSSISVPRSTIRTPDTGHGKTEIRHDRNALYRRQQFNGLQPAGKQENRSVQTSNTNKLISSEKVGGSINNFRQGNGKSPYHNGVYPSANQINVSFVTFDKTNNFEENGSAPCASVASNFRDLLAKENDKWESDMASPVVEKTLYIDSVHLVKPQMSISVSSDMEVLPGCVRDDAEVLVKNKDNVETSSMDYLLHDIKQLPEAEKEKLWPGSLESFDSSYLSISDSHDMQMDVVSNSGHNQDVMLPSIFLTSPKPAPDRNVDWKNQRDDDPDKIQGLNVLNQDLNVSLNEKVADGRQIDLERELLGKPANAGNSKSSNLLLSLRPPPPKSPSESWLKRTLPTVSTRNPSLRLSAVFRVNAGVHASKSSTSDSRWETIVRTSNMQRKQLRLPEEFLTPITES